MTAEKLEKIGVQTVAVVATSVERARLYVRHRPIRCPVGADPDLVTHRAYGVPRTALTPEIGQAVESACVALARELELPVPDGNVYRAVDLADGFPKTEADQADSDRHQAQFTGQFLVDRDGIVRWANIEGARDGLAGLTRFPTEEELLTAARAL